MYAVIESGGRQYRVEKGSVIEVDRLEAKEGEKVSLRPVMLRDKDGVVDPVALSKAKVEAKVTGHLRGEKIRVFKYKAKKGYSRRAGHRAELTRLEVVSVGATGGGAAASKPAAAKKAAPAKKPAAKKSTTSAKKPASKKATTAAKKPAAKKPAAKKTTAAAKKPAAKKPAAKKSTTAAKSKPSTTKKEQ